MDATRYLPFVGRLLIGLPFTMSGLGKLAAYGKTTAMIAAADLPVPPLAYAVAALELGGGVLLVEGYQVRAIAAALAVFCVAAGVSFHSNFADQNQMIHFLKNVMMAGGCFRSQPSGQAPSVSTTAFPGSTRLLPRWQPLAEPFRFCGRRGRRCRFYPRRRNTPSIDLYRSPGSVAQPWGRRAHGGWVKDVTPNYGER